MIRREDLLEAIAECEGQRHPTSATCIKLAAFYTILRQMEPVPEAQYEPPQYSFTQAPEEVELSDTEFARLVKEKGFSKCMPVIDEAMQAVYVTNPKMHEGIIRQLRTL